MLSAFFIASQPAPQRSFSRAVCLSLAEAGYLNKQSSAISKVGGVGCAAMQHLEEGREGGVLKPRWPAAHAAGQSEAEEQHPSKPSTLAGGHAHWQLTSLATMLILHHSCPCVSVSTCVLTPHLGTMPAARVSPSPSPPPPFPSSRAGACRSVPLPRRAAPGRRHRSGLQLAALLPGLRGGLRGGGRVVSGGGPARGGLAGGSVRARPTQPARPRRRQERRAGAGVQQRLHRGVCER